MCSCIEHVCGRIPSHDFDDFDFWLISVFDLGEGGAGREGVAEWDLVARGVTSEF